MKIKPLSAFYPFPDKIDTPDAFCDEAKNLYQKYVEEGMYQQYPRAALYIYQIESPSGKHTGIVGLNEVDDFFAGKVKKHEATLSEREKQQMELFLRWSAVLKPVLLTYPPEPGIQEILETYIRKHRSILHTSFKDRVKHRLWAIHETEVIEAIQLRFQQFVNTTYIADGHHRTSTMALLHEQREQYPQFDFDHLFCAYFATDQLDILDYNRAVELPDKMSASRFMAHLAGLFDITPLDTPRRPESKHELVMYLRKEWYALRWRPELMADRHNDIALLDASLLNTMVLQGIMGIEDVRSDTRVTYVDGSKGLNGLRKQCGRNRVGFALYPVLFSDMMLLADAGQSLPPKSTYFEPRLKSGLLVQGLKKP